MTSSLRRTIRHALTAAALIAAWAVHAQQADRVVPPASMSGAMAPADETFALTASSAGLAQIEGARLVLKKVQRSDVREFAQATLRAHSQALDELRRIVAARGSKLASTATGRHADMVTKLSGLAMPDLEDAFVQRFGVDAHKELVALYERHAKEGQDPALRKHALIVLESLRERMAAAQKLVHAAAGAR
jgi:putative membrane protein